MSFYINFRSDNVFKVIIVNPTCHSRNGGSFAITPTVPLKVKVLLVFYVKLE